MSGPGLVYTPHPDATPESEAASLANVYGFILDCHTKKNAVGVTSTDGDDTKEGSLNDFRADSSLPR